MKLKALTAAVLAAALLSACGSSAASSAAPAADTSSETAASADNSGDLLAQIQQKAFDALSDDDHVPLDSLLAAISRFSLQTSARNQWFGTVTARDNLQIQQHIEILLADGTTRLKAAITAQSAERLELDEGKEVLVLLKAPWISITRDPDAAKTADNQLQGTINHIERGQAQCEVLMTLADGQPLCATVPLSESDNLEEGAAVTAYFNADRVIIATLC